MPIQRGEWADRRRRRTRPFSPFLFRPSLENPYPSLRDPVSSDYRPQKFQFLESLMCPFFRELYCTPLISLVYREAVNVPKKMTSAHNLLRPTSILGSSSAPGPPSARQTCSSPFYALYLLPYLRRSETSRRKKGASLISSLPPPSQIYYHHPPHGACTQAGGGGLLFPLRVGRRRRLGIPVSPVSPNLKMENAPLSSFWCCTVRCRLI